MLLMSAPDEPLGFQGTLDLRVLVFTLAITVLTGLVFGLAPATRGTRVDLTPALKEGAGASATSGRPGSRWLNPGNVLVVTQVALTVIVLAGAVLLVRTLQNLRAVNPGFNTRHILNFTVNPMVVGYKDSQLSAFYGNLQSRLNSLSGVQSVSYSSFSLLSGSSAHGEFHLAGTSEHSIAPSDFLAIGPGFFETMQMSILRGRDFTNSDFVAAANLHNALMQANLADSPAPVTVSSAPEPVIVNQTFARRYFGNKDPLGQRFQSPSTEGKLPGFIVVGVVSDTKYNSLSREFQPTTYAAGPVGGVSFEIRTADDPKRIIPAVRNAVAQMDDRLPLTDVVTESESIDRLLAQQTLIARLSSFFGVLALALACIGLYGLLSYEVTRRTREIGIRMALGADRGGILRTVVGHGSALALAGLAIGIVASLGVTQFLRSFLYDVHPSDRATLIVVASILLVVAVAACCIPARRAMRVDPMVALRHE